MEQITPNGFKPNTKFEKCKGCYKMRDYLSEFLICNSCQTPSGNKVIDDFIRYTTTKAARKMEFVPFNRFKDIEFIAEGGFSKIYKATWIDGPLNSNYGIGVMTDRYGKMTIALKELNN